MNVEGAFKLLAKLHLSKMLGEIYPYVKKNGISQGATAERIFELDADTEIIFYVKATIRKRQ